ncbi:MAG: hypothetical protein ACRC4N_12985, partial [Gammaproteobacteria bacterium]
LQFKDMIMMSLQFEDKVISPKFSVHDYEHFPPFTCYQLDLLDHVAVQTGVQSLRSVAPGLEGGKRKPLNPVLFLAVKKQIYIFVEVYFFLPLCPSGFQSERNGLFSTFQPELLFCTKYNTGKVLPSCWDNSSFLWSTDPLPIMC